MRTLLVFASVFACGAAACTDPATSAGPADRDPRFIGEWMIDQPAHAGYEASTYTFSADGSVGARSLCVFGGPPDLMTGFVQAPSGGLSCAFAEGWRSDGPDTLIVDATCTDGRPRDVHLAFPSDPSRNGVEVLPEVVAVDGEPGWAHDFPTWRWARCEGGVCPSLCGG